MSPYRARARNTRIVTSPWAIRPALRRWPAFLLGWLLLSSGCASGWNAPIRPSTANALNGCPIGSVASRGECRYLDWGPTEHSSTDAAEEGARLAQ